MLLVGNTTIGQIAAYNPRTGAFRGFLQDSSGNPIVSGLWAIAFGNGNKDFGPTTTLYYSVGGADETTGEFGGITTN